MSRRRSASPYCWTWRKSLLIHRRSVALRVFVSMRELPSACCGRRYSQNAHAMKPVKVCPMPHHAANNVRAYCLLDGRYSSRTVVSSARFPPAPKATMATKEQREMKFGLHWVSFTRRRYTHAAGNDRYSRSARGQTKDRGYEQRRVESPFSTKHIRDDTPEQTASDKPDIVGDQNAIRERPVELLGNGRECSAFDENYH